MTATNDSISQLILLILWIRKIISVHDENTAEEDELVWFFMTNTQTFV